MQRKNKSHSRPGKEVMEKTGWQKIPGEYDTYTYVCLFLNNSSTAFTPNPTVRRKGSVFPSVLMKPPLRSSCGTVVIVGDDFCRLLLRLPITFLSDLTPTQHSKRHNLHIQAHLLIFTLHIYSPCCTIATQPCWFREQNLIWCEPRLKGLSCPLKV